MIDLVLRRTTKGSRSTIGELYINDTFFCYTLEDVERGGGLKVYGQTAIPKGSYKVVLDFSNRFQKILPHILDVPGFEGIRIHGGNTDKQTLGCVLVGANKDERNQRIYNCQGVLWKCLRKMRCL